MPPGGYSGFCGCAWGSHGIWRDAGHHTYKTIYVPLPKDLVDVCSKGTRWETWNRVVAFDYHTAQGLNGTAWPAWMSTDYSDPGTGDPAVPGNGPIYRWGNPKWGEVFGNYRLTDGPTGPAAKGVWAPDVFK